MPWSVARRVYDYESELIERIINARDPEEEYFLVEDELYEDADGIYGLDLGVASTAIALSAARCIPFSSCNGGVFGGNHREHYPLVAFHARSPHLALLLECAEQAECGLEGGNSGALVLYAGNINCLRRFAVEVMRCVRHQNIWDA